MNNKKFLVYALTLLLSLSFIAGLSAPAKAETETWVNIPTLPYTITESGNYRITTPYNVSGLALSVNASNVVVDGQNNLIRLNQTEGDYAVVIAPGSTNVLLENINETGADYGVYAQEGNFTAQSCLFTNNTSAAVFAYNVTNFAIHDSMLSNNSYGLVAVQSSNFTINDCHVNNNTRGIEAVLSDNITVRACYMNNNTDVISAENCTNLKICDSTFEQNGEAITAHFTIFTIDNISVTDNDGMGIRFMYSNLTATNFEAKNNSIGLYAIFSNFSISHASIIDNVAALLDAACNGTMVDCALDNNTIYGALMIQCNSTIINDCSINNNGVGMVSEFCQN